MKEDIVRGGLSGQPSETSKKGAYQTTFSGIRRPCFLKCCSKKERKREREKGREKLRKKERYREIDIYIYIERERNIEINVQERLHFLVYVRECCAPLQTAHPNHA